MEPTHYKTASDISCKNMVKLAKKESDQNHNMFLNRMISKTCQYGDKDGYFLTGEVINPKHCDNKRPPVLNFDWWKTQSCVGEQFNINTKNKNISKKDANIDCNPTDFSKANDVSQFNDKRNTNFKYNTPKVCGMN
jgi:hypothetical protein